MGFSGQNLSYVIGGSSRLMSQLRPGEGYASCAIYMREGCWFCKEAIRLLSERDVPFTVFNQNHGDFTQEQFEEKFGAYATYPQVIMWGKKIGGCDDLNKYIDECMTGLS